MNEYMEWWLPGRYPDDMVCPCKKDWQTGSLARLAKTYAACCKQRGNSFEQGPDLAVRNVRANQPQWVSTDLLTAIFERAPKDAEGKPTGIDFASLSVRGVKTAAQRNRKLAPLMVDKLGGHPAYVACWEACDFHWDPARVHSFPPQEHEDRARQWNAALDRSVMVGCRFLLVT
jgi:hypothetical protein